MFRSGSFFWGNFVIYGRNFTPQRHSPARAASVHKAKSAAFGKEFFAGIGGLPDSPIQGIG
jgi:hypothetical protein